MPGVKRFIITDETPGRGKWRFLESRRRHGTANRLYREIFERQGQPLLPGDDEVFCSREEFAAGYDYQLGIDVLLTLANGSMLTLQEKFLFTKYKTVTVEYMQNPEDCEQGDWFTMKAQLYFVGYDRRHDRLGSQQALDREISTGRCSKCHQPFTFQDWILLNWPAVQLEDDIRWQDNRNKRNGAMASFRYAPFTEFPSRCVIATSLEHAIRSVQLSFEL